MSWGTAFRKSDSGIGGILWVLACVALLGSACTPKVLGNSFSKGSSPGRSLDPSTDRLVFISQPLGQNPAGTALSVQPVIEIQDKNGNRIATSTASVTLELANTPGTGTLSGTRTVRAVAGVAAFSGLSIDKAGSGYTLTASSDESTGATSSGFEIIAGPAAKLAFTTQPSATVTAGSIFAAQPVVEIQDAQGNKIDSSTASINLSTYSDSDCTYAIPLIPNSASASLTGTLTQSALAGTASFAGVGVQYAGSLYLGAASDALASDCSSAISVAPAALSRITFQQSPLAGTADEPLDIQPILQLLDTYGNLKTDFSGPITVVANFGLVSCEPGLDLPSATLGTTTISAVSGIAEFTDVQITDIHTTKLRAFSGTISACSKAFSVNSGAPSTSRSMVTGSNNIAIANGTSSVTISVLLKDSFGNRVSDLDVALHSTRGTDRISPAIAHSDGGGTASFTVSSSLSGESTYAAIPTSLSDPLDSSQTVAFVNPGFYGPLFSFTGTNGNEPLAALVEYQGKLFGTTLQGGAGVLYGTIFSMDPDGRNFQTLHHFDKSNGEWPHAALVLVNGVLYGTTEFGGASLKGTIFKIQPDGTGFQVLHHFAGSTAGAHPLSSLTSVGGVLYGTTSAGGANDQGTVFKIHPDGSGFQSIAPFDGTNTGKNPLSNLLFLNGRLHGVARAGGAHSGGTLFRFQSNLTGFEVLYSFAHPSSGGPSNPSYLIEAGGVFYGTTDFYGPVGSSALFKVNPDGSGYQTLRIFDSFDENGHLPTSLIHLNGRLYGNTRNGGDVDRGTLFQIETDGSGFTRLHSFSESDGDTPIGGLISVNGVLFGTSAGGTAGFGTVYRYAP